MPFDIIECSCILTSPENVAALCSTMFEYILTSDRHPGWMEREKGLRAPRL